MVVLHMGSNPSFPHGHRIQIVTLRLHSAVVCSRSKQNAFNVSDPADDFLSRVVKEMSRDQGCLQLGCGHWGLNPVSSCWELCPLAVGWLVTGRLLV